MGAHGFRNSDSAGNRKCLSSISNSEIGGKGADARETGIHFEDYPELQGYQLPDWSHMTHPEAERFTAALYGVITRDFWRRAAAAP
jgi:hypothetical protein